MTSHVIFPFFKGGLNPVDIEKTYTEEDWGDIEKADIYPKSKILAEKAAWDYIKELPGKFVDRQVKVTEIIGQQSHGNYSLMEKFKVTKLQGHETYQ